jgi:hypothetical protein
VAARSRISLQTNRALGRARSRGPPGVWSTTLGIVQREKLVNVVPRIEEFDPTARDCDVLSRHVPHTTFRRNQPLPLTRHPRLSLPRTSGTTNPLQFCLRMNAESPAVGRPYACTGPRRACPERESAGPAFTRPLHRAGQASCGADAGPALCVGGHFPAHDVVGDGALDSQITGRRHRGPAPRSRARVGSSSVQTCRLACVPRSSLRARRRLA